MPNLHIIGGPNGSGKTTIALRILPEVLDCIEYVNADAIAAGLSPFNPESVAIQAGRLMLERIEQLADSGVDFAFETTLASRSFVRIMERCREKGYHVTVVYFWLSSPEMAIARVAARAAAGGHGITEEVIRRRCETGRRNFIGLYLPSATSWMAYSNSGTSPVLVARGEQNVVTVYKPGLWREIARGTMDTGQVQEQTQEYFDRIDAAIKAAVADAIEEHRRAGRSIVIWRDGQVVWLSADQIPPRRLEGEAVDPLKNP